MRPQLPRVSAGWRMGAATIAAGLVLAACASSGGSGAAPTSAQPPPPTTSSGGNGPAAAGAAALTIKIRSGPLGTYLTDGAGKTLYQFASDTPTTSTCSGQCLTYWPPAGGAAKAGAGVSGAKLATITGTGGAKQVTYAGHPLYYFAADAKAGDTNGQGLDDFGAKWSVLSPSGQPITGAPTGGAANPGYGAAAGG